MHFGFYQFVSLKIMMAHRHVIRRRLSGNNLRQNGIRAHMRLDFNSTPCDVSVGVATGNSSATIELFARDSCTVTRAGGRGGVARYVIGVGGAGVPRNLPVHAANLDVAANTIAEFMFPRGVPVDSVWDVGADLPCVFSVSSSIELACLVVPEHLGFIVCPLHHEPDLASLAMAGGALNWVPPEDDGLCDSADGIVAAVGGVIVAGRRCEPGTVGVQTTEEALRHAVHELTDGLLYNNGEFFNHVNNHECEVCELGGTVVNCEYCNLSIHSGCLVPSQSLSPVGPWACEECYVSARQTTPVALRLRIHEELEGLAYAAPFSGTHNSVCVRDGCVSRKRRARCKYCSRVSHSLCLDPPQSRLPLIWVCAPCKSRAIRNSGPFIVVLRPTASVDIRSCPMSVVRFHINPSEMLSAGNFANGRRAGPGQVLSLGSLRLLPSATALGYSLGETGERERSTHMAVVGGRNFCNRCNSYGHLDLECLRQPGRVHPPLLAAGAAAAAGAADVAAGAGSFSNGDATAIAAARASALTATWRAASTERAARVVAATRAVRDATARVARAAAVTRALGGTDQRGRDVSSHSGRDVPDQSAATAGNPPHSPFCWPCRATAAGVAESPSKLPCKCARWFDRRRAQRRGGKRVKRSKSDKSGKTGKSGKSGKTGKSGKSGKSGKTGKTGKSKGGEGRVSAAVEHGEDGVDGSDASSSDSSGASPPASKVLVNLVHTLLYASCLPFFLSTHLSTGSCRHSVKMLLSHSHVALLPACFLLLGACTKCHRSIQPRAEVCEW